MTMNDGDMLIGIHMIEVVVQDVHNQDIMLVEVLQKMKMEILYMMKQAVILLVLVRRMINILIK